MSRPDHENNTDNLIINLLRLEPRKHHSPQEHILSPHVVGSSSLPSCLLPLPSFAVPSTFSTFAGAVPSPLMLFMRFCLNVLGKDTALENRELYAGGGASGS